MPPEFLPFSTKMVLQIVARNNRNGKTYDNDDNNDRYLSALGEVLSI